MNSIVSIITIFVVIVIILVIANFLIQWVLSLFERPAAPFEEPQSDAAFEAEPAKEPILVECDTAGKPTPPGEVMVHVYDWSPAEGSYRHSCMPLSLYNRANPAPASLAKAHADRASAQSLN